jgi:hypothetical protein
MNRMLRWPHAEIRESTAQAALYKMATTLRYYARRDHWNDDYPGGIQDEDGSLDFGHAAARTLRDSHVRSALRAIHE